ncbi:MAG: PadR family transcriptional regulator [Eubacteriales bacterium]|nr:PadR family transcriptional regulator [Eubacteriales bacterium]
MAFPSNAQMLDLLVLAVLNRQDAYGYQISQQIKAATGAKDSTLYPVLRRLQENQELETYDQQYQGRNRRYYSITPKGRSHYQEILAEWNAYKEAIDQIVNGGVDSE